MDRWRSWNAAKLPGRAVNRFIRGWSRNNLALEVHRTACIVTHPPGGEGANDALVNPANERLQGTSFSPEQCWKELYGDPTTGRWDKDYATYPFQSVDALVTEFCGDGLSKALAALPADEHGVKVATGNAIVTRAHGELTELYSHLIHAVAPFYRLAPNASDWEAQTKRTYHSALIAAQRENLNAIALPLLGAGVRGVDLPAGDSLRVAAEATVGWDGADEPLTIRFGVQDSTTANALADAIVAAMKALDREDEFELMARPDGERWALRADEKRVMHG